MSRARPTTATAPAAAPAAPPLGRRTPLEIAQDESAPNAWHARAHLRNTSARFTILALQCECVLRQAGIAAPPPTAYSNAAAILARIAAAAAPGAMTGAEQ